MINKANIHEQHITVCCKTAANRGKGRFPYRWDLNIYRGCEHGCRYCFALYTHKYMDNRRAGCFFSTIYKKENIADQLERQLASPSWKGEVINLGGVTDNYQPLEAENGLMTEVLEVLIKYRNPCIISTKSDLILRDYELIDRLSRMTYVNIASTITCVDEKLAAELEPGAVSPDRRFAMLKEFAKTNASTGVHSMPLIPYLTDDTANLEGLYQGAVSCGARYLLPGYLNLKGATREAFFEYLFKYRPYLLEPINRLFTEKNAYKEYRIPKYREIRQIAEKYKMPSNYREEVRSRMPAAMHKACAAEAGEQLKVL